MTERKNKQDKRREYRQRKEIVEKERQRKGP